MKQVLPFELLHQIVESLQVGHDPIEVDGMLYRPIVFQVNATQHYVFCLTPIHVMPENFFNQVDKAYETYLDGGVTKYIFFRDKSPEELKLQVEDWYRGLAA